MVTTADPSGLIVTCVGAGDGVVIDLPVSGFVNVTRKFGNTIRSRISLPAWSKKVVDRTSPSTWTMTGNAHWSSIVNVSSTCSTGKCSGGTALATAARTSVRTLVSAN